MFVDPQSNSNKENFTTCLMGKHFLQDPTYRDAWKNFRGLIPLSDFDFDQYYTATLMAFAEYVQMIPATRHVFYAQPGGLFQLGLDRALLSTKLALKAYQEFEGRQPDDLTSHELMELYAVFSAALLSDLGLLTLRFDIKIEDQANLIKDYDPYRGSMRAQGKAYSYAFRKPELNDWGAPATLVLAERLLSQTQPNYIDSGFAWLSRNHDVLQLWYSMLLELTPVNEGTTRRRYLISLIPTTDSDLIQDFLLNIHNAGLLLPNKQNRTLFTPKDMEEESLKDNVLLPSDWSDGSPRREFEKVFGGTGASDASNSQTLGSIGAALAPQVRYGLAFLGWLMTLARSGKLWATDGQAQMAFGKGGGQIVFDIQRLQQEFSKINNNARVSPQELISALREIQILKSHNISLRNFELKGLDSIRKFEGLVLPNNFVLGNLPGPKIALGLTEMAVNVVKDAAKSFTSTVYGVFRNKPVL